VSLDVVTRLSKVGPLGKKPFHCPQCQTTEPAYRMLELTNYYMVKGRIEERITGYIVACQKCPQVWAVSSSGVWKPDPQSRPYVNAGTPVRPQETPLKT
jgi:hypothetical protein